MAARAGGLVEVAEHGRTGLLVEEEGPAGLAGAVMALLADPAAADRMGRAARARAVERFGWDRCVDEYERLYRWSCGTEDGHD